MANERRLIDANVAKEMITNHANEFSDVLSRREKALWIGGGTSCIDRCPTVDAVEVVHGRWIFDFSLDDSNFYKCSICGRQEILLAKESISEYCPYCHCGAKMDGGKDNE